MAKAKPSPLEELARAKAKEAIDEFLKQKEFPLPKVALLAMRPLVPALREVWINGFLAAWGLATSAPFMEEVEKRVDEIFGKQEEEGG